MNDIVTILNTTPVIVLEDSAKRDYMFEHIEKEIAAFKPDLSTEKGRSEIKSFAFKVTKTKTAIDDARKTLIAEERKRINGVNAEWNAIEERLVELANKARKPLTDWENAETARLNDINATTIFLNQAMIIPADATSEFLESLRAEIAKVEITEEIFRERTDAIKNLKNDALTAMATGIERIKQAERDRKELEQLRADREKREADEAAAAAAKAEADQIEADRVAKIAADAAEADRKKKEQDKIAEDARQAERDRLQAQHDKELRDRDAEIERSRKAEEDRIANEDRIADEKAAREKNEAHISNILREAKEDLMKFDFTEDQARTIVLAIKAKRIRHIEVNL